MRRRTNNTTIATEDAPRRSHQRLVSRQILIPATAQQWNPGVTEIEGTHYEHDCGNIMGCKCNPKRRTCINIGCSTHILCPGHWVVTDVLGKRYIISPQEMEKALSANEKGQR